MPGATPASSIGKVPTATERRLLTVPGTPRVPEPATVILVFAELIAAGTSARRRPENEATHCLQLGAEGGAQRTAEELQNDGAP